jgi:SAM-dependent methyltransferase
MTLKHLSLRFITHLSRLTSQVSTDMSSIDNRKIQEIQESMNCFALDTSSALRFARIETNQPMSITWGHSDVTYNKYLGVLLREGEYLELGNPVFFKNSWLRLSFAPAFLTSYKPDSSLYIEFIDHNHRITEICSHNVLGNQLSNEWFTFEIDLQNFDEKTGYLRLSFVANVSENSVNSVSVEDYPLIISKFTIAPKSKLALVEARTFRDIRIANEVGHFSEVYEHEMYKSKQYAEQPISITHLDDINSFKHEDIEQSFRTSRPLLEESVYAYANRLLSDNLQMLDIDFSQRILSLSHQNPSLRVLSLCSGSARNEAALDAMTGHALHWTLQDINEHLLIKARKQFSPSSNVELLVGDVNTIQNTGRSWDVIMCVSGLHHVVELEKVIKFISESLAPQGEFWLIGEYVGKSGNRLRPEAQVSADQVFSSLAPRYRFNHHTKDTDVFVPKNDYSIDCFEGIRADEIESVISSEFFPIGISRNNSFLWRLVNLAYADNYNLEFDEDVLTIETLVKAELLHFNK